MITNITLYSILIASLSGAYITADKGGGFNLAPTFEGGLKGPVWFGMIVLLQALFGGQGFTDTPESLANLFKKDWVKFLVLYLICFSGTQDLEESFFILISFLAFIQLCRTPKERKDHPYLV
tara:strand:- start:1557 stop:1922 length:366 start_codon:yes stop_codon:yes gene_type:complete